MCGLAVSLDSRMHSSTNRGGRRQSAVNRALVGVLVVLRTRRFRHTISASSGTVIGSAAGALLPFVVARLFEVGRGTDVYFLVVGAVQLVAYMLALVVESVVVPFATKALQRDGRGALRAFSKMMAGYVLIAAVPVNLLAIALVGFALIPAAGLSGSEHGDAMLFLLVVGALPVLAAISGIASAANFVLDRFAFTTGTQVLRAGGGMTMAITLGERWGLIAVALGLTLGEALRVLVLMLALPKEDKGARAVPLRVGGQVLRLASPTLFASIVIAVNPIVDKTVAARLEPGATTIMELGDKIFYIPMVLLVAGVTKVSATVWARHAGVDNLALHRDFWRVQKIGGIVTSGLVCIAIPAVILTRDVAADLLGMSRDTHLTAVFIALIIGLPFALAADLAVTMLIILRRTRVFPGVAVFLVLVNLIADIVGAHLFGVVGIAVSTTLVRVMNVVLFLWVCERCLRQASPRKSRLHDPATQATRGDP